MQNFQQAPLGFQPGVLTALNGRHPLTVLRRDKKGFVVTLLLSLRRRGIPFPTEMLDILLMFLLGSWGKTALDPFEFLNALMLHPAMPMPVPTPGMTVLRGSAVLQLCSPERFPRWEPDDWDIYLPSGDCQDIAKFCAEILGVNYPRQTDPFARTHIGDGFLRGHSFSESSREFVCSRVVLGDININFVVPPVTPDVFPGEAFDVYEAGYGIDLITGELFDPCNKLVAVSFRDKIFRSWTFRTVTDGRLIKKILLERVDSTFKSDMAKEVRDGGADGHRHFFSSRLWRKIQRVSAKYPSACNRRLRTYIGRAELSGVSLEVVPVDKFDDTQTRDFYVVILLLVWINYNGDSSVWDSDWTPPVRRIAFGKPPAPRNP